MNQPTHQLKQHRQKKHRKTVGRNRQESRDRHLQEWVHPSSELLRKISGISSVNRPLIDTAAGSANTSFESVMESDGSNSPSPCCSCLPHKKKHNTGQVIATAPQHKKVNSVLSSCHSMCTGWFSPDTGKVVIKSPFQSITSTSTKTKTQQIQLNNPFFGAVNGYSDSYRNILSAEPLLRQMQLGEDLGVTKNVPGKLLEEHDVKFYYSNMEQLKFLESGGAFYSFTCRPWMTPYEKEIVRLIANMSSFEDETRDNYVPFLNMSNPADVDQYTYVLQKAAYILPGVQLDDITPKMLSSNHYHKCCQPVNGTKIWDDWEEDVFRFTRPIIPHIYKMTIQFKVSEVRSKELGPLSCVLGVRVDKAILMERTKRSVPPKVDATAKAKSILCYTAIPGGLLVTHATVILNTAIPTVVAKVIHTFGGMGLAETCETAERTRLFFFKS